MPSLHCHFPVTVQITGRLDDDALARLAAEVERALGELIDRADRELARRHGAHPGTVVVQPGQQGEPSTGLGMARGGNGPAAGFQLASYHPDPEQSPGDPGQMPAVAVAGLFPMTAEEIIDFIQDLFPESQDPGGNRVHYGLYALLTGTDRPMLHYLLLDEQGRAVLHSLPMWADVPGRPPLGLGAGYYRLLLSPEGNSRIFLPGKTDGAPILNLDDLDLEVVFLALGAPPVVKRPRYRYYPSVRLTRLNPESPLAVGSRSSYDAQVDIWQLDPQWRATHMALDAFLFAQFRYLWTVRRLKADDSGQGVVVHQEESSIGSEFSFEWPAEGRYEVTCEVTVRDENVSPIPATDTLREDVLQLEVKLSWLLASFEKEESRAGGQRIWSRSALEQLARYQAELDAEKAKKNPNQARIDVLTDAIEKMRVRLFAADLPRIGPFPIHAVFLEKDTSKVQPLNLFLAFELPQALGDLYVCSLIDVTYPPFYATYPGTGADPVQALIDAFETSRTQFRRTYPPGHILARVTVEDLRGQGLVGIPGFAPIDYVTETMSWEKTAAEWLTVGAEILGAAALVASFVFPPSAVVGGALLITGAIGATLSIVNIVERVKQGSFALDVETFSDIANIAAALAGIGGAAAGARTGRILSTIGRAEASAEELATLARAGIAWQRAFLLTGLGVDVANGILVADETYAALEALAAEDDSRLLRDFQERFGNEEGERRWRQERYLRLLDILVRAGLNATLIVVSARSNVLGVRAASQRQAELHRLSAPPRVSLPEPKVEPEREPPSGSRTATGDAEEFGEPTAAPAKAAPATTPAELARSTQPAAPRGRSKAGADQAAAEARERILQAAPQQVTRLTEEYRTLEREQTELQYKIRQINKQRLASPHDTALRDQWQELVEEHRALIARKGEIDRERFFWSQGQNVQMAAERYAALRPRTPGPAGDHVVEAANGRDVLGRTATKDNPLEADHIHPVARIVLMNDFILLNDRRALSILNDEKILQPLNKQANAARGDYTFEEWPGWAEYMTPEQRQRLIAAENTAIEYIAGRIRTELGEQRRLGY